MGVDPAVAARRDHAKMGPSDTGAVLLAYTTPSAWERFPKLLNAKKEKRKMKP